jgi:hypothetical protein
MISRLIRFISVYDLVWVELKLGELSVILDSLREKFDKEKFELRSVIRYEF